MSTADDGTAVVRAVDWDDPVAVRLRAEQELGLPERYDDVLAAGAVPAPDPVRNDAVLGCWIAETAFGDRGSGEPLGCVALLSAEPADGYRTGEVKRVYGRPAGRGRGVAVRLMEAVIRRAAELGLDRLVLATGPRQSDAARLCLRTGWQRIPNYGEYRGLAAVHCFEQTLWADPPPLPPGQPVRHRPSARALVFDPADRLLLTRNLMRSTAADGRSSVREFWALPGGGIEQDEDARQAAGRELSEETGLRDVPLAGPVVRHDYWVPGHEVLHQLEQLWWGRTADTAVSRAGLHADEDYLVDLRWFRVEELRAGDRATFPRLLPDLAESLLRHGTPAEPFVIVADSTRPAGRPVPEEPVTRSR